ncbi:MAG: hypothetical protein LH650_07265 [Chloroflexi bacterium]|nr:hypothetical protein [Chloroflexota bacterium]
MRTRSLVATSLSCALLFGASAAVSAQDDPATLLAASVTATSAATSFHFLATADGTINLGDSFGGAPLPITGTKAEGDVSVTPLGVQLTFAVPLGPMSLSGGLIYPNDGFAYIKLALPGASAADLWHRIAADEMIGQALGSPAPGTPDMAAQLQQALTESGAVLTDEGDVPCAAGTCTKLHLEVPSAALDSTLGSVLPGTSPAPSAAAAAPIPVDILVDNATQYIDSLSIQVVEAGSGTDVTLLIQLSAFNTPVTITAPPADQVTDDPLF